MKARRKLQIQKHDDNDPALHNIPCVSCGINTACEFIVGRPTFTLYIAWCSSCDDMLYGVEGDQQAGVQYVERVLLANMETGE